MSHTETRNAPPFDAKKLIRVCVVALAAGVLLGVIGPFGSYNMPTVTRYGFWVGAIFIGMMIHVPLYYAASWYGRAHDWPNWLWVSLSAVVAALPMTFVVNGIFATLFGASQLDSFATLYPLVLAISLPMQWLAFFTSGSGVVLPTPVLPPTELTAKVTNAAPAQEVAQVAPSVEAPKHAALFARLPARIGRSLICLEMEDHYVRVHTDLGDAMIHLRMADAETEVGDIEGMRIHRSYWVARRAVTGWQRDGKTLLLTLSNGKVVPVARDRQPLVKAAGWLS